MARKYIRPNKYYPRNWNRIRFGVFKRDEYKCKMCDVVCSLNSGLTSPQCHHLTPVKYGGSHHWDNLVTLCERCHTLLHLNYILSKK
jgi:5-methylcytosine-specific restriction enzyme A